MSINITVNTNFNQDQKQAKLIYGTRTQNRMYFSGVGEVKKKKKMLYFLISWLPEFGLCEFIDMFRYGSHTFLEIHYKKVLILF